MIEVMPGITCSYTLMLLADETLADLLLADHHLSIYDWLWNRLIVACNP